MSKKSAGILLYRLNDNIIEFFLVHPGGPFFINKDEGSWTIPKGEFEDNEKALNAAIREFEEETGFKIEGNFIELTPIKQKSGKVVYAWALEKDIDCNSIQSNSFSLEWPPKSGTIKQFPEIDRAQWFNYESAQKKVNQNQFALIMEIISKLKIDVHAQGKSSSSPKPSKPEQLDLF